MAVNKALKTQFWHLHVVQGLVQTLNLLILLDFTLLLLTLEQCMNVPEWLLCSAQCTMSSALFQLTCCLVLWASWCSFSSWSGQSPRSPLSPRSPGTDGRDDCIPSMLQLVCNRSHSARSLAFSSRFLKDAKRCHNLMSNPRYFDNADLCWTYLTPFSVWFIFIAVCMDLIVPSQCVIKHTKKFCHCYYFCCQNTVEPTYNNIQVPQQFHYYNQ